MYRNLDTRGPAWAADAYDEPERARADDGAEDGEVFVERFETHEVPLGPATDLEALPDVGGNPAAAATAERAAEEDRTGPPSGSEAVKESLIEMLKTIYDPEIPLNIYDLGLIYGVEVADDGQVDVKMTLTSPGCPVGGMIVDEVNEKLGMVGGVTSVHVDLVWDPPWSPEVMTDEAKLQLGLL